MTWTAPLCPLLKTEAEFRLREQLPKPFRCDNAMEGNQGEYTDTYHSPLNTFAILDTDRILRQINSKRTTVTSDKPKVIPIYAKI